MGLQEHLLWLIQNSGQSLHSISTEANVSYASLHGFVNDGRKISIETAEKLLTFFDVRLTPPR